MRQFAVGDLDNSAPKLAQHTTFPRNTSSPFDFLKTATWPTLTPPGAQALTSE